MTYSVTKSAGAVVSITDGTINTDTHLQLLGRNKSNYGEPMAQNLVRLLENFAADESPNANVNVSGAALTGQLWYDTTDTGGLKVFNGASWDAIATGTVTGGADIGTDANRVLRVYANDLDFASSLYGGPGTNATLHNVTINEGLTLDVLNAIPTGSVINGDWTLSAGSTLEATYADIAERFEADKVYEYGTVVEIGGDKEITESTTAESKQVFGVVAQNPAFIMNISAGDNETHPPIALAGRTPVKVIGSVKKGDRLVSSDIPGTARAANVDDISSFAVIGRSLDDKLDSDPGFVWVAVGAK